MVKKIQGYTLQQCVGKGSSGQVFRATHCAKQGEFAIKVIDNQLLIDNPKAEECLINEVKILSKIGRCQNIVSLHQLIKTKNNHYFVYDFCNGGNLHQKLKKVKKLTQSQAIKYVKDILNAYKILNKYKVLHRDLKPENILFHNGKLKLADFGLCKGLQPEQHMTKTMLGSPIYMAPEVLKGESYTSKADIWSLGVIFFQMLYGYCPFHSSSIAALASKIDTTPLQFPQKTVISNNTKQILKKMLNKDHFRRIGWIQLFNQFGPEDGELNSARSFYDIEEKYEQRRSKSKSKSRSKHNSKKTSLCFIQNNTPPILMRQMKFDRQQSTTPQKQNRLNFNSSKYMVMINKSDQKSNKRPSNYAIINENYSSLPSNGPLYYKDFDRVQPTIAASLPQTPTNTNNCFTAGYTYKPRNNSSKKKIHLSPTSEKNVRDFVLKLEKVHQEFVKVAPYCETLLLTQNKDNLKDVLQFLYLLRSKVMQLSREFIKVKKQMHSEHEDLETMIKYQIIGIENVIECLCNYTGDKIIKSYGGYVSSFAPTHKFKSYAIEKVCSRICQMQI